MKTPWLSHCVLCGYFFSVADLCIISSCSFSNKTNDASFLFCMACLNRLKWNIEILQEAAQYNAIWKKNKNFSTFLSVYIHCIMRCIQFFSKHITEASVCVIFYKVEKLDSFLSIRHHGHSRQVHIVQPGVFGWPYKILCRLPMLLNLYRGWLCLRQRSRFERQHTVFTPSGIGQTPNLSLPAASIESSTSFTRDQCVNHWATPHLSFMSIQKYVSDEYFSIVTRRFNP